MKTTVIYHSADFDGKFCHQIAKKFLGETAEYIGWDFGDDPIPLPNGKIYVMVMDLPLDRVFGWSFEKGTAPDPKVWTGLFDRIVWIDHHKSSIETHPQCIAGYRIDGVAACRLAWQWFTHGIDPNRQTKRDFIDRKVSEPLAVRLAGEYDIWDKRDPRAELFQHGLRSQNLDSNCWRWMLGTDCDASMMETVVDRLLRQGMSIQYARDNEYATVIKNQGFDVEFEGIKFLSCCSHECDIRSQLFAEGIKPCHDALLGFTFNGKEWRVSLYQIPGKQDVQILEIAKKFGGGGHPGACGFIVDSLPFLP